ncbi:hypothetical protein F5Y05DRAFT_142209 [Hypoxylon sp. FL0543]|nr:hypothetical protein F5Y05DRAFT_142209 [Hypoxylon sp. FL0543]
MDRERSNRRRNGRGNGGGYWNKLKQNDGFFKNPRDTTWTIDSTVNGEDKPSGYDSNSLITIIRSSQCVAAFATLVVYDCTFSFPSFWLALLSGILGFVSICFSILALFLRHRWALWLVLPEVFLTIAWIVLLIASALSTPKDGKYVTFQVGMVAIVASLVLWIPTCLLMLTPFFHKLMPRVFGLRGRAGTGSDHSKDDAFEMSALPPGAATGPPGGMAYYRTPVIASPQPTRAGQHMDVNTFLAAQQAAGILFPLNTAMPHPPAAGAPPQVGPNGVTSVPFTVHPSQRAVSPASTTYESMHTISPVTPTQDPREVNPWNTGSVRGGEVRRGR